MTNESEMKLATNYSARFIKVRLAKKNSKSPFWGQFRVKASKSTDSDPSETLGSKSPKNGSF